MDRRTELASFLRTRRERLTPADVGLPHTGRRRTPGLRREELALLAGMSATWYTYLEQGRDVRPSDSVIAALATTLRLDGHEREHLFRLAGHSPASAPAPAPLDPAAAEVPLLFGGNPAYIIGPRYEVLSANPAALELFPGLAPELNFARWTFLTPDARRVLVDWEPEARGLLARLRTQATRYPGLSPLIEELREGCPEVREWWPRHEVQPQHSGRKRLRAADGTVTEYAYTAFHLADHPDRTLVVYSG